MFVLEVLNRYKSSLCVQHIKQQDERNDRATVQVDMLKKENEELSEVFDDPSHCFSINL